MPADTQSTLCTCNTADDKVLLCSELANSELESIAQRYRVDVIWLADAEPIRGSYWGDSEAGLVGNCLFVRSDTPVHSALHELCHYVCMPPGARATLDTNAGGDYDEENGVCFLQILLAGCLPTCGQQRMLRDMDAWGYTFRFGSAAAWFERDAEDARDWLTRFGLIDAALQPTWSLREES